MVNTEFVFQEFQENRLWFGYHAVKEFMKPDGTVQKFGNITWFTNLEVRRKKHLVLTKNYHEGNYQKYHNFNAININRLKDIPLDYDGIMGVPITFTKLCSIVYKIIFCLFFHISLDLIKMGGMNQCRMDLI